MKRRAIIIGSGGQDASYLAEHLLADDYAVFGITRRHSVAETQEIRIDHLVKSGKMKTFYGDLLDMGSLYNIVRIVKPTHIFHLGSQSHVRISFDIPLFTAEVNAIGVLKMLIVMKDLVPKSKYYFAGSSECFGNSIDKDGFQRLTTPMHPTSPYGCAKVFGVNITRHYREAYKMFCCSGILFNHTSVRRGSNFVLPKIVKGALEIKYGLRKILEMGDISTKRDFGHSKDYTMVIKKILEWGKPRDWIVATGENHSIEEACQIIFSKLGLDYKKYVTQNKKYLRPEELKELKGDSSETRKLLGWKPLYTFEMILNEMIEYWDNKIRKEMKNE